MVTIVKFINFIAEDNDVYTSDVAELKLKEIDYRFELKELNMLLSNLKNFSNTNLIGEIELKTSYPRDLKPIITFASFIIGFFLSTLFVFFRYAIAKNYKE